MTARSQADVAGYPRLMGGTKRARRKPGLKRAASNHEFTMAVRKSGAAGRVTEDPEARGEKAGPKTRKRERVRCSSLVDWPVYPRLRGTMQRRARAQFRAGAGGPLRRQSGRGGA